MRGGKTQNLIGSMMLSGLWPLATPGEAQGDSARVAALSGKLVAILLGSLALGLAFALFPLRGSAATRADVLLVGIALVVQGLGYAALSMQGARGVKLAPFAGLLAVPLFALAHNPGVVFIALGVLALLEAALMLALLAEARRFVLPLATLALPALVALGVAAPTPGTVLTGLVLIMAPLAALLMPHRAPAAAPVVETRRDALPALLGAALSPEGRELVVTDAMGILDVSALPAEQGAARLPGGSLVDATLIADRVMLLQALSQAAREGIASRPVSIRLREGLLGAGYPTPPRFESVIVRAYPIPGQTPGHAGRAAVLIERGQDPREAQPAPVVLPAATASPALLAKALHDGIAPFNAGLGFLEMVADPRLAPRDFTALHDFTAEAHKAMCEAHRNTVLLGQWMRLTQDEAHARMRGEASPRRLLTEAIRMLNLEDMEKRGDLLADQSVDGTNSYTLPLNAARFGLAVLLRFGMGAVHADLGMAEVEGDLAFTLTRQEGSEHTQGPDTFQQALEQAACAAGDMTFDSAGAGVRRLRLKGAARSRRTADAIRLAS